MTTQHEIDQSKALFTEHEQLTRAEFRIDALLAERDALKAALTLALELAIKVVKNEVNVGGVLRAAQNFGASMETETETKATAKGWKHSEIKPDDPTKAFAIQRWRIVDDRGIEIAQVWVGAEPEGNMMRGTGEANAALIVKCVNSYDKLVEALKVISTSYDPASAMLARAALSEAGAA